MQEPQAKKRLFLVFLIGNWLSFVVTFLLVWWIAVPGLERLHPALPWIVLAVLASGILATMLGFGLIILSIITGWHIPFSQGLRRIVLKIFLPITIHAPLTVLAGKVFGFTKEDMQRSFLELNNHFVGLKRLAVHPSKLLILLPQCLQYSGCNVRITRNIENCKECGRCAIASVVGLCRKYGVAACVATGGTLARKIIVEKKPEAIVAVACERELVSGIQDCYPLPVYAILNARPYGPCMDTQASLRRVETAVEQLLHKGEGEELVSGLVEIAK